MKPTWIPPELEPLLTRPPSETTPVLLELAARQAARRRPIDLLKQYARDGFVQPSAVDLRLLNRLDGLALEAAAEFEALQLSPVAPLGACSVVAPTSQHRTLSAARGTEVVSDPTNVLALECARRLLAAPGAVARLCTIHQVLRAQPLPPRSGFSRHFRLFALAEAGPGQPDEAQEVDAAVGHLRVFDRLFDLASALGLTFPERRATVLSTSTRATLARRIRDRLRDELPGVDVTEAPLEAAYYDGLRVLFGATAASGQHVQIGDTGVFDWVGRLTSNRRLRFVASGLGLQLMPLLFARP